MLTSDRVLSCGDRKPTSPHPVTGADLAVSRAGSRVGQLAGARPRRPAGIVSLSPSAGAAPAVPDPNLFVVN